MQCSKSHGGERSYDLHDRISSTGKTASFKPSPSLTFFLSGLYDISDPDAEVDLGIMLAMSRGITPAPQNEDYFRAESRVSIIDLDEFQVQKEKQLIMGW